jgi:hypothetical protein
MGGAKPLEYVLLKTPPKGVVCSESWKSFVLSLTLLIITT